MVKKTQKDDPLASLVVDRVWWVARAPRSYDETMEAWRTSCPRLPVWEEAVDRGYVARRRGEDGRATVEVTPEGRELLALDDPLNDELSANVAVRSGFMK